MLLELRAENYAVIDHAVAGFGPGLNLLTGETGAGKSILIDALALLLGGKASSDIVRHGAEKAVLGCVFEATPGALAVPLGLEPDEVSAALLALEVEGFVLRGRFTPGTHDELVSGRRRLSQWRVDAGTAIPDLCQLLQASR